MNTPGSVSWAGTPFGKTRTSPATPVFVISVQFQNSTQLSAPAISSQQISRRRQAATKRLRGQGSGAFSMWMHDQGLPTDGRNNLSLDFVLTAASATTVPKPSRCSAAERQAVLPDRAFAINAILTHIQDHGRTNRDLAQTRPQGEATLRPRTSTKTTHDRVLPSTASNTSIDWPRATPNP